MVEVGLLIKNAFVGICHKVTMVLRKDLSLTLEESVSMNVLALLSLNDKLSWHQFIGCTAS